MPKNSRPSMFDPLYRGKSLAEINQAQNQYDLLEAQEKANELQQQQLQLEQAKIESEKENNNKRIREERKNAELKANAIRQAEEDRFNNELKLELLRQSNENLQRKLRLCDNLGVDYNEIQLFIDCLSNPDKNLNEDLIQINSNIEYKEKALKEYRSHKPDKDDRLKEYNMKINSLQIAIESAKKTDETSSGAGIILLNLGLICGIFGFGFAWLSVNADIYRNITIGLVICMIAINFSYKSLIRIKDNAIKDNKIRTLEENLDKLKREQDSMYKKYSRDRKEIMSKYNNNISRITREIKELKEEKEKIVTKIKELSCNKYNKFMEFRTSHYNEEMEMLLKKLELTFLINLDNHFISMNGNIENHVKKEGTVKDYIQYMRKEINEI